MRRNAVIALCGTLLLVGCGNEGSPFGGARANIAGAASVVETQNLETVPVEELINALNEDPKKVTLAVAIKDYETAEARDKPASFTPWRQMRDSLQDRIIVASQSRCGFYEEYLKRFQADSTSLFGSLATVLGGAGAIVTGADAARALSGLAGISSGIGAELQKDLFAGVTSTVIVPGIEKRRHDIMAAIMKHRCLAPDRYTIGLAISEALAYHSACSMDAGIAEGGKAIQTVSAPGTAGLAAMATLMSQIGPVQQARISIEKGRRAAPQGNGNGSAKAPSGGSGGSAETSTQVTVGASDNGNLFGNVAGFPVDPCQDQTLASTTTPAALFTTPAAAIRGR